MDGRSPPLPLLLLFFSLAPQQLRIISHASSTSTVRCHASERDALMEFKRGLRDPSGRLSSWVGQDCCSWEGVRCSNTTGHVVQLNLRNRQMDYYADCSDEASYFWDLEENGCRCALFGGVSESLLSLQHLRHLDLSGNIHQGNPIPEFLGSFTRLRYLNLSAAGFTGKVPDQLGNISNLRHLDLSHNSYTDDIDGTSRGLYTKNAGWISQLAALRVLNMDWVDFSNATNWLQAMNMLSHLQKLRLESCGIVSFSAHNWLIHVNFTSLTIFDLSYNFINSSVPNWLFNLTTLEHLDLGWNYLNLLDFASITKLSSLKVLDLTNNVFLKGFFFKRIDLSKLCKLQSLTLSHMAIMEEFVNLKVVFSDSCLSLSLEELDLSVTQLSGTLPDWLDSMKNIKHLDLSSNSLYGPLPASLGSLSSLQYLDISGNHLNGTIAQGMFEHIKGLVSLYIGGNSLSLSEIHLANLPATLKSLDISSNILFLNKSYEDWIPPFQLEYLDMSSCKILPKPQFPRWLSTQRLLYSLDLSSTGIKDTFPKWLPTTISYLYLSNNQITGHVPQYLLKLIRLDLQNNSISSQLPSAINDIMPIMKWLDLSMNNITGSIPFSICQIKYLALLRLFKNNFSGKIPDCWENSTKIFILDLSNNNLHGAISNSICNLHRLQSLHLSRNNFSGQISACLKSCTRLISLDLGNNQLAGNIPTWIEENLLHLQILNLGSNDFTGDISPQLSNLEYLEVLDLSNNKFSGVLPQSFGNFSALKGYPIFDNSDYEIFSDGIWLFVKGSELEYDLISYARILDLSNNGLHGYIPEEMGNLNLLISLNLSYNYLEGQLPMNIDRMQQLEVLDLSRNNLSGIIPSSLASLNFLDNLNLSYNNLSCRIPIGSQLQTFNQFSYIGNPNLCGFPLSRSCTDDITRSDEEEEHEEDTAYKAEIIWLFASIALGFISGFWIVCGVLVYKRRWRYAFFRAIDHRYDKLYVMIVVNMAKLRRE